MKKQKIESIYPLSAMQQGLLFHTLYEPGTGTYYELLSCRIEGGLNVGAFKRAWQAVVDRHAILRTSFVWEGLKEPVQVVQQELKLVFREEDWRDDTPDEQSRRLEELLRADREQGCDLAKAPLMKLGLVRVAEEAYYFIWGNHHILFDGWCRELIIGEVFKFYEGYCRGVEVEMSLVRPYRDYISWLGEQNLKEAEKFWREELRGIEGPTELGLEQSGERGEGESSEKNEWLSEETSRSLEEVARKWQVTLNIVVEGAWAVVLSRYSRQQEVVFGTTVSGRGGGLKGIEGMVGLFINTLPMRAEVREEERVKDLMRRLQEKQSKVLEYEYSPLMEVQGWSEVPKGVPLFKTSYGFQNYPLDAGIRERAGSSLQISEIQHLSRYDHDVVIRPIPGKELLLNAIYDGGRFEGNSIERLLMHLKRVLEGMAVDEQSRVIELPMMSEQEQQEVIVGWNQTAAEYPRDRCVHELFEQQVELAPDAVAVVYEGEQLSYHELNRRANQLAYYLRERGVGAEVKVGLCVERSLEMIIGLLGVMKAGGAYLPLDADYPPERLSYMIEDSDCPVIVTTEPLLEDLPVAWAQIVKIDEDWPAIAGRSDGNPELTTVPANLAYLIYTSGSTGKPKGVGLTHQGLCNLTIAQKRNFQVAAGESVLQFASFSFDAATWEWLMTLICGARLILISGVDAQAPEKVLELIVTHDVGTVTLPPSVLLSAAKKRIPSLKTMIVAGEACPSELVRQWSGECRFINAYGPTESTVCATMTEAMVDSEKVSIGRANENTQVYVLGRNQDPMPVGIAGEIYIAGLGLARSYVNRADETAEKFLADPFGEEGRRMYRTGDLGRYRKDGSIEYLGRVDDQVKIRGYRIELGEVEAALNGHPAVAQVRVLAREDEPGEKRLVGYVVSRQQVSSQELREYLQERLPDYMAPGAIVQLEAMPLTANGKLDRRALPKPELGGSGWQYVGPRTAVEEIMCGIWAEVLGVEKAGIYDNFFELGGHSLLATQVVSRVLSALGVEVSLRSLFAHPTAAAIAAEIEQQQRSGGEAPVEAIVKVARERDLPLSYAQQRLWFIDQLEPGSATYNIPCAVRLSGRIDADALRKSFNEIIARHEALRTSFPSRDGEPRQEIHQFSGLQPDFLDLMRSDEAERQEKLQEVLRDEAGRGFDLSRGPLIRAKLIRLAEDRHVLIVNMHHIVSDGWSMEIIIREFAQLYEAFTQGREFSLPELEIQYADYAVWQRGWLQGEVLDTQLQYWRRQLEGVEALELPTDRARPAVADYRGSSERVALSGELTEKLRQMSRQEGVTLFMSLLAGFQFLLARYSGQDDIAVGTPISGRNRRELEGLIGFFVNTLVMRVDLGGARTVSELLGRVRETALEAYAHQDLPFEKLVEELQPERSLSRTPLFQVMFAFQNAPFSVRQPGSLLAEVVDVEVSTAKFDITLTLNDGGERLTGAVVYNSDLFDASTIKRMIEYYECLLEGIVSDITQPIWRLPRVTESEKKQLLLDWNDTGADYDPEICIHEMIEGQVGAMPDAIAVVFADQRISYGELDRRTNQAGNFLRRRGIGPETRVGLMLERSIELVVWMIGILKAGGAYVPIDAGFPAERIGFMLEDAEVKLLLMEPEILEWRPVNQVQVVPLDRGLYQIATESEEPLPVKATSRNLAYAIYTSGSTGYPKGVAVSHQEVSNFFTAMDGYLEPEPGAVWLAVTGIAFDISVLELLWTLSRGIQVVIQGDWRSAQPTSEEEKKRFERSQIVWQEEDNSIMAQITRRQVSHLQCTPSLARALCEWSDSVTQYSSLSKLLIGGEAFPVGLAANLKQLVRGEIRNMYGPTETTIWSTTHALNGEESSIPIGHPIANTRGYVLDGDLGLVPVGAAGELCLGGKGVVRGYLNRSELTAERFLPDEYGTEAGGRIYRTGDLVRYQADGKLEFLGRIDHQVKIRGMRIELGEIEVQQNTHPGISESVVTAGENEVGEKQLVSYFVGRAEGAPSANELRDYLKERLPEYLVPSLFVELEKLPLTANGKLDRRALPKPEQSGGCGEYVGPRSAVEEIVCGIWEEVLRVEKVGIYDNFFDLGGHSLLATQVVSRVRSALGVEVPLRVQFSNQTVAAFALEVEQRQRGVGKAAVEAIRRVARDGDLPLSYAQQRLWFIDQLKPGSAGYNIPSMLRVRGDLRQVLLERVLSEVVRRHEVLRTRFEVRDDQPVQVIEEAMLVSAPVIDVSGLEEEQREREASRVLNEEAARSFDLSRGPLIRAVSVRLGEQDQIVLLTMHHIVSDWWSSGVLIREVSALYEAYSKGEPSLLSELPIQYADYAVWQRERRQTEIFEQQLSYWKERLAEAPLTRLITDYPQPPAHSFLRAKQCLSLSASLTARLHLLSRQEGCTLFMTLLAVFYVELYRYTHEDDLVVGTPISNRNRAEIEGLIGFFINMLALRTNVSGNPSLRTLLGLVREATIGAYTHQDIPFEKLVEGLRPERSHADIPLFHIVFIFHNALISQIELPGLTSVPTQFDFAPPGEEFCFVVNEEKEGLNLSVLYSSDLFEEGTVVQMLKHYRKLLEEAIEHLDIPISDLKMLDDIERQTILEEWNRTDVPYLADRCIHELIGKKCDQAPEAVALVYGQDHLSYGELNDRANRLANYLRRQGVEPESVVGIYLERGLGMVVSILGVLKAGGVYLPLDPTYPKQRVQYMLEDSWAPVVLSEQREAGWLEGAGVRVIAIDTQWDEIDQERGQMPYSGVKPESPAYVIYTSGSTGQPKGVAVAHRNVARLLEATREQFGFDADDVWTMFHSSAFDFSVWEMWGALLHGGRLVVVPYWVSRETERFYELLIREQVTVLNQTPAAFRQLVAVDGLMEAAETLALRWIVFGGEALDLGSLQPWFARHGAEKPSLVNMYGITETTVHVTQRVVREGDVGLGSRIGRAIPDLQVYLLDAHLHLAPQGIAGEICVGGAGLAQGYLNDAALTAERFIPNPFGPPGERLYRSGDLARWMAGGDLEYLGRTDHQVKVRGFRIELGEIESVVRQLSGIRDAVITLDEDVTGDRKLIGYYVCERERELTAGDLTARLRERVPEYMVPTLWVKLDALPLTLSGKIDRKRLPAPEMTRRKAPESYMAPRNHMEEVVAAIFREVLKLDSLGVHDSFFELGGHSLMATQIISRLRKTFRVEIPMKVLFTTAFTVEDMANTVTRLQIDQLEEQELTELFSELTELSDGEAKSLLVHESIH